MRMKVFYAVAVLFALVVVGFSSTMTWDASHGRDVLSKLGIKHHKASSGVYYEIFVRSFYDSNGDGIGDLNGVTAKLNYLQSLGVSGIWLMPVNPSPSYHGYDVTDYFGINPQYGTLADFRHLLQEAHKRGIKVIMDLVLNHTSNQNPWFQKSASGDPKYRKWYTWADKSTNVNEVSAVGSPAWHSYAGDDYLGIFSDSMPDLNYDNPQVRQEMIKVGQFWLKQGVDGFRLDAAKNIYDDLPQDDGKPKTLAKNLAWWNEFRKGIAKVNPKAYLVGEVWDNSYAGMGPYLKPFNSVFNFPLAQQLIDSAKNEQSPDLGFELNRVYSYYDKVSGHSFADAPILSNHDQNRVMSQLDGSLNHMKMAAAELLTLPGHPFVYYGEEVGMRGRKPDEDIREPMRWNKAADAKGDTAWEPPSLNTDPNVSVESERTEPDSLLNTYKMLIHWRMQVSALRDGSISEYPADGGPISAYVRQDAQEKVLVVHNLSGTRRTVPLKPDAGKFFSEIMLKSKKDMLLKENKLEMPPYSTAVLK